MPEKGKARGKQVLLLGTVLASLGWGECTWIHLWNIGRWGESGNGDERILCHLLYLLVV